MDSPITLHEIENGHEWVVACATCGVEEHASSEADADAKFTAWREEHNCVQDPPTQSATPAD